MLAPRGALVKSPLALALGLAACAPPGGPTPASDAAVDRADAPALNAPAEALLAPGPENGVLAARLDPSPPRSRRLGALEPGPRRPSLPGAPWSDLLDQLGAPVEGARLDLSRGEALEQRLAEEDPEQVERYGVNVLPFGDLLGDGFHAPLCEAGAIIVDGEDDQGAYTATFDAATYMLFVGEPEARLYSLSADCRAALLASGGEVGEALDEGCDEYDENSFFAEGSACRSCLEERAGDLDACEEAGECLEEAPQRAWVQEGEEMAWYGQVDATMLACAPDWTVETVLLAEVEDDGTLPDSFDHERWAYLCIPIQSGRGVAYTCVSGYAGPQYGDALVEGVVARMIGVTREGSDEVQHKGRMVYAHGIGLEDGQRLDYIWGFTPGGVGIISMPQIIPDTNQNGVTDLGDENFGFGLGGWGQAPHALRPDGSDASVLDHTYARDWLGTMVLKFSTNINGIPIHISQHNRCAEGAWEGPFDDGSWRCTRMDAPTGDWLLEDVNNTWTDSSFQQAYAQPMATIASTGLPDEEVPGGFAPHVAGSPALANPDWEGCSWPHTFQPDLAPMEDTPGVFGERASLWAHTYKFGKDPDQDLRTVLVTNRLRDFCPPEGWSSSR